jgi:hypothetical protein
MIVYPQVNGKLERNGYEAIQNISQTEEMVNFFAR